MSASQQLIDVLLNRHDLNALVEMVTVRAAVRARESCIVTKLPAGIAQRTPEWYATRKGMLTASEFKTAGAAEVSESYVMGKVFPQAFPANDAMAWGCRFEDLACATYEHENSVAVREYGLLVHPETPWIGASPDGITEYGVMIEIKTPFSRKRVEIDKRIAAQRPFARSDKANLHARYLAQVQGQLEVCGLQYCDFVVAHIDEVEPSVFWQLRRVSDQRHRYAIVVDVPKSDGGTTPRTSPLSLDDDALCAWRDGVLAAAEGRVWYVHVRELGVTRIERDTDHWARLRDGLQRTKDAIDAIMHGGSLKSSGDGNPPLFGAGDSEDDL